MGVPIAPASGEYLRNLRNRRNLGVHAPSPIAGLRSGDAGCIAGAVVVCPRSGTLAIPHWSSVSEATGSVTGNDLLRGARRTPLGRDLLSCRCDGCTSSPLPPTDLGCAGHGDQEGGWGCDASLFMEAQPISCQPTLYSVSNIRRCLPRPVSCQWRNWPNMAVHCHTSTTRCC